METKFKIVEEEEYIFAVSGEEIKKGDYHRFTCFDGDIIKKIIAYKPKGNVIKLDLPLLPEFEPRGFDEFEYTEDDLRKAIEESISWWEAKPDEKYGQINTSHDFGDEFIQSLKQPKWFVAETRPFTVGEMADKPLGTVNETLKTTTINNKIYLEGTYLN
jgi:hypothetical protein